MTFWSVSTARFWFVVLAALCPFLAFLSSIVYSSLPMFVLTMQAIPKKFVDNLKKKLPQSVTLKGPSGLTWDVELKTIDDTLFFNHGWQEFVKDHSLEETDLLVFRYNGWSQFDVLIFDGKNLCEKGASYFVRKCGPTEHDNGCLTKKKIREGSIDDVHTPLDDGVRCPSPLNYVSDDSATVPSEQYIISLVGNKRTRRSAKSVGRKEPATCGEGMKSTASDGKPLNTYGTTLIYFAPSTIF